MNNGVNNNINNTQINNNTNPTLANNNIYQNQVYPNQNVIPNYQSQQQIQEPQLIGTLPTNHIEETKIQNNTPKKKKSIIPLLLFIILLLGGYIYYLTTANKQQINALKVACSPVQKEEEKTLELNSTLVLDLYSRVATTAKEDYENANFDNNMKLYLAYRQIPDSDKYSSNCNLFSSTTMEPATCNDGVEFVPKAIKEERMILELKKLYGENNNVKLDNIQLGRNSCIGAYQYIPERGEFVQGQCSQKKSLSFKVDKKLTSAISTKDLIVLTESVKYTASDKMAVPEHLTSGEYKYYFKLDMNYNYIFVKKEYQEIV